MRMSMHFMILLSVLVFYFHSFVNMCACHVVLHKLTYVLTYHFAPGLLLKRQSDCIRVDTVFQTPLREV